MSNYNERLTIELVKLQGRAIKDWDSDLAKAKQDLTSLIKELVAEAKPKTMPSNLSPENYETCERVVNQYHQNLLKALEEV